MSSLVVVRDKVVDVKRDDEQLHVVHQGALRVTDSVNSADSWGSDGSPLTSAIWSINPPSLQTITSRYIKARYYIRVTCDNADFAIGEFDSLRQFPVSSLIDVSTIQLNGESVSDNTADTLHAHLCYDNDAAYRRKQWSTTAAQSDQFQRLSDYVVEGTNRRPQSFYGENAMEPTRASVEIAEVVGPRELKFVVTEPIWLSPLSQGDDVEGMVNLNELRLTLRFKSNTSRVMTCADRLNPPGPAPTNVQCTFYRAPELLVRYYSPDMLQAIPSVQVLPYKKSQDYRKPLGVYADGETKEAVSDSIRLSMVPDEIMLFARRSDATADQSKADAFLSIESVKINWNNESGLFATSTKQDLYDISRGNDLDMSYVQWSKHRGGVMKIRLGKNLGLPDGIAPSTMGSFTVQAFVTFKNVAGENFDADFYLKIINSGSFQIAPNVSRASLGLYTPQMILGAREMGHNLPAHEYEKIAKGSFFASLRNILPRHHVHGASKGSEEAKEPEPMPEARGAGRTVGGGLMSSKLRRR
jgi:hypothetical protein